MKPECSIIRATSTNSRRPNRKRLKATKKSSTCGVCLDADGKYKCPKCRLPYCSVKCCKEHKENCPALKNQAASSSSNNSSDPSSNSHSNAGTANDSLCKQQGQSSKYLAAEQLTRDPLENAARRRRMLNGDSDNDDDDDDLEEGWRITKEMMDRLDGSDWLRKELADGGLRQIIAEIDAADEEDRCNANHHQRQRKRPKLGADPEPSPREVKLMKAKFNNPKFANFVDRLLVTAGVLMEEEKTAEQDLSNFLTGNEQVGMVSLVPIVKKKRLEDKKLLVDDEDSTSGSDDDENDDDEEEDDSSDSDDSDTSSSSS